MASSNSLLGLGTAAQIWLKIMSSAALLAVYVPPHGLLSALRLSARAWAAAAHVSVATIFVAKAHAASGFFAPFGMPQAWPSENVMSWPSLVLGALYVMSTFGEVSARTLRYHCSIGNAAILSLATGLSLPKKSALTASRAAKNSGPLAWAVIRLAANVSAS